MCAAKEDEAMAKTAVYAAITKLMNLPKKFKM